MGGQSSVWYSLLGNLVLVLGGKICYVDSLGSRLGSTLVFATARLVGLTGLDRAGGFMVFFQFLYNYFTKKFGFNLQDQGLQ